MRTFCTIITADYFPYALALMKSIRKFNRDIGLQVLVVGGDIPTALSEDIGIRVIPLKSVERYNLVDELYKKYAHINYDHFRWSLKPILISYLLEKGYDKVIFVDCDICFFSDFEFLFNELDKNPIILTPHWSNPYPLKNQDGFIHLLTKGVFNAGFIGSNREGLPALGWWAEACHFKMGTVKDYFVHDDQRYLDFIPLLFENVKIIPHRGCNLMAGNYEECKRELSNGIVMINGLYPVVFIHFNKPLIRQILMGYDPLLLPYYKEYEKLFGESGIPLSNFLPNLAYYQKPSLFSKIKWKMHLKTRLKAILYHLAEKL